MKLTADEKCRVGALLVVASIAVAIAGRAGEDLGYWENGTSIIAWFGGVLFGLGLRGLSHAWRSDGFR